MSARPSRIVGSMKTFAFLLVISVLAVPAFGQSTEFGVLFGGSKRINKNDTAAVGTAAINESFSLSNSTIDLYYALKVDEGTMFKINIGRINSPIGFLEHETRNGQIINVRRDVEGEVQHASGLIEYRFSEPFGSTGMFLGVGVYRHAAAGFSSATDYGFSGGITGDFPISRQYAFVASATYHQTYHDFRPRYLVVSGGLRLAF